MQHEIFDPRNGTPILTVRTALAARIICLFRRGLDYAPTGQGWL